MQRLFAAASVLLFVLFASLPAFAQASPPSEASRKAELVAAWQAASEAGAGGPKDVSLIDQATLKLPASHFFVPQAEGARVLRALGNVVNDASFVGLVVGTGPNDGWIVVIRYIKEGYIKDDDAKNWNADELLKNLKDGVEESNKDRVARGFPEMQVIGWVQPPNYDAATHRLVWSLLAKDKDEADNAREEHQLQYLRAGAGRLFQPQSAVELGTHRRRQGGGPWAARRSRLQCRQALRGLQRLYRSDRGIWSDGAGRRRCGQEARSVCNRDRVRVSSSPRSSSSAWRCWARAWCSSSVANRAAIRPTARHEGAFF